MSPQTLPLPLFENYEWQFSAACREVDPETFFYEPKERGHAKRKREQAAKKVCAGCPVLTQCLKHALNAPEHYGVWGGTTEEERQRLLGRHWRR